MKVVYMSHRRFLQADHAYQKNKKAFDGTIEKHRAPKIHSGEHIFRMIKNLKVVLGRGKEEDVKRQRRQKRMQRRIQRVMITKL
jgi:hypothetical protein